MTSQVRVGVVGTSWWADLMYLPGLQSHPQAVLGAICGRNLERATEMAEKYSIPIVHSDYKELLDSGELDALAIVTPDGVHFPIAMAALDRGLHVLCEKPMAMSLAQAQEMADRAASAGLKTMVMFTNRWLPHIRYVEQLIRDGFVGECYHCDFSWMAGYAREGNYQWKWDCRHGLGVLGDLGSHMIDLAMLFCGDITTVSANLTAFIDKSAGAPDSYEPSSDSATLDVTFGSGAQGTIHASAVAHMADRFMHQRISLYGGSGSLEVVSPLNGECTISGVRHNEECWTELHIPDDLLQGIPFDLDSRMRIFTERSAGPRLFVDAVIGDLAVKPDFSDGLRVQRVLDAAVRSSEQGHHIELH